MDFNILIDPLPLSVCVGGRDVPISADFRTGILFETMMFDRELDKEEKILCALDLYFPGGIPQPAHEAVDALIWFYSCGNGKKEQPSGGKGSGGSTKRCYDYDYDAPYIYSAFLSQYRIDLQDCVDLHWWKFMAMFLGLNEENEICKIMEYRSVDLSKIKNKAEKERFARLKRRYALPDTRTAEQKQMDIGAILGGMIR